MKDLYTDRLDSLSFADVLQAVEAVGTETQRLEFKREIPARKLANKVCSFANAAGGVIIIGVEDPKANEELVFAEEPPDISSDKALSYSATINALVYPRPPFEIHGYSDGSSSKTLVLVRVGSSTVGPHEYIAGDDKNLPVRRGTETASLGLADIDALQRRRSTETPSKSPFEHRPFQKVVLNQYGMGGDFYFAAHVSPAMYGPRRLMEPQDDQACLDAERQTRGDHNLIHPPMSHCERTEEGIWMHTGDRPGFNQQPNVPTAQIEVDSDAEIFLRFQEQDGDTFEQYFNLFLTMYAMAQEVFYTFSVAPAARFYVVAHLSARAKTSGAPQYYEQRFEVDLARESFADAFTKVVAAMFRSVNKPQTRAEVHELLGSHATSKLPMLSQQLERWLSTSE